jgi:DNA polymerase-3 subunit delta
VSDVPQLYLVLGDEDLLVSRALAELTQAAKASDPEAEIVDVNGRDVTDAHVMDLNSPSMFGTLRVLIIRQAQELPESLREAVAAYAESPAPDACLAVTFSGGNVSKRVPDTMTKAGATVIKAAKPAKQGDRVAFVIEEARRHKQRINGQVAAAIIEAVGPELGELAGTIQQLAEQGRIDEDSVHRFHRGRAETTGFQVSDAAFAGDVAQALALLRAALDGGTASVLIVSAFASGLRDIARVAAAGGGASARVLGMPDWKFRRVQPLVRVWSDAALATGIAAAALADERVKGGGVDEVYALERLVLDVCAARKAA